ncbi:hypothetical protein BC940DRAFT_329599 [Gongronella butleri]|nr:hypothetical protein BC940DRAFT_329599 [Gongronella butleri]
MFFSKNHFELTDIPDLTGKFAIVTGANTGLGRVCALEMARNGCHVVVASRTEEKALKAIEEIKKVTGSEKVEFIQLDLLSLQSVKRFTEIYKQRHDKLHILMNNAGVMMCPYGLSEDGIETQFATNHVSHFYLTMELLPLLEASAPSRIVNVSSGTHHVPRGKLDLKHINESKNYGPVSQYGLTKAFNILFTRELQKRLEARGVTDVYVNASHPGASRTDLSRHYHTFLMGLVVKIIGVEPEVGALGQLYVATSPEVEEQNIKAAYYSPSSQPAGVSKFASSDANAKELWDFTDNLLKERVTGYTGADL